jgi:hypothetical protein
MYYPSLSDYSLLSLLVASYMLNPPGVSAFERTVSTSLVIRPGNSRDDHRIFYNDSRQDSAASEQPLVASSDGPGFTQEEPWPIIRQEKTRRAVEVSSISASAI